MKDILFTFFNYFVFFYTSMLAISFIVFAFLSFISLKRRKDYYVESYVRKIIKESPYTPGVSVIAPAYNEEKTIIDNINSMLALEYPVFEVIIVNDGSTDKTLEKITEYYELIEVPYAYIERIKTKPFKRLLKSTNPKYSRLIVVDKENGGTKADASNAGINASSYPYFICTDVDCILEKYALYRCISPIISSDKQVIAVSGTMLMANGCVVKDGQIVDVKTPRTPIPLFQNLEYMETYNPDYVLILSGDHIYKMDYEVMLEYHKANNADVTIAAMPVPIEEASRFGIVITDENNRITEFEEKPANPRSNLASMGIYIFSWPALKEALLALSEEPGCDFGKHVIPYCHGKGERIFAYEYNGYWKDVGTLGSYWEANMELIDIIPEFNLYEEYWKIYTRSDIIPPQYIAPEAVIDRSIIGEGTEIYGEVHNSVIGAGVTIEAGAVVRDSIVMRNSVVGAGAKVDKAIVAEDTTIGAGAELGVGEYAPSTYDPKVYQFDLVTIGEHSVIPENVKIGKNTAISGVTVLEDYPDGLLASGDSIIKAGGIK